MHITAQKNPETLHGNIELISPQKMAEKFKKEEMDLKLKEKL